MGCGAVQVRREAISARLAEVLEKPQALVLSPERLGKQRQERGNRRHAPREGFRALRAARRGAAGSGGERGSHGARGAREGAPSGGQEEG